MKLEDLRTLCEVARCGSFSKAAENLHCTQSTASLRVRRVEDWIGARLLERSRDTRKEVTLTQAGATVLPKIEIAMAELGAAWSAFAAERRLERAQIAVFASHTPGLFVLPGVLAEFGRTHPSAIVNTHVNYTHEVLDRVRREGSPTCFGIVSQPEGFFHPDLTLEAAIDDPLCIVVGPGDDPAGTPVLDWLRDRILLITNRSSSTLAYLRRSGGIEPKDIRVLGSIESVKAALRETLGFAVLSRRAVGKELALGSLREVRVPGFSPSRVISVVRPKNQALSDLAQAFVRALCRS